MGLRARLVLSSFASLTLLLAGAPAVTRADTAAPPAAGGAVLKQRVNVNALPPSGPTAQPMRPGDPDVAPAGSGPGAPSSIAGRASHPLAGAAFGPASPAGPSSTADSSGRVDPAIAQLDEFTGVAFDNISPPDTQMAVSAKGVIELTNTLVQVFRSNNNKSFQLSALFGQPVIPMTTPLWADPKVLYDNLSNRFFSAAFINDICNPAPVNQGGTGCTTNNDTEIDVAVSDSDDPSGGWAVYTVATDTTHRLLDQPKVGVTDDKVVMAWNITGFAGPFQVVVIQKSDMLAAAASAAAVFLPQDTVHYNILPAQSLSSTSDAWAMSIRNGSNQLTVFKITGTPGGGNVSMTSQDFGIGSVSNPPLAEQPNNGRGLDDRPANIQSAVFQNGVLWGAGDDGCTPPGDNTTRACMRFERVLISGGNPSLDQDTDIGENGADLFYPAVTVDAADNLWIASSVSSTSEFPAAGVTFVPAGKIPSVVGGVDYAIGTRVYDCQLCTNAGDSRNRFGDYSGAGRNPAHPMDIYTAAEFGATGNSSDNWSTAIGRFTVEPPHVASLNPNHVPERSPCTFFTTIGGSEFAIGASTVAFGGSGSPSVSVSNPETLTAQVPPQAAGTVDVTVTTAAGTSATVPVDQFTYDADTTPPTTSASAAPAPNGSGWNNSDVTVSLSAADEACGTGVKSITYSASGGQNIAPTTISSSSSSFVISGEGTTTVSYFATDVAGNSSSTAQLTVKLDKTPPVITINVPAATTYTINQVVNADYTCADAVSGLASCVGTVVSGSPIDTSTVGVHSFTVSSSDIAGNSTSTTVSYTVAYGICNLYDPTKVKKAGSTVPIRIELCDAAGNDLSSGAIAVHADLITPGSLAPTSTSNPGDFFIFDATLGTSGGYIYNEQTKGLPPGTYMLHFSAAGDPTDHTAVFMLS